MRTVDEHLAEVLSVVSPLSPLEVSVKNSTSHRLALSFSPSS